MVTMEQKKQLQIDAGIPHLPTDLTYECRIAIAGGGERAYDWSDKPHRLVYDLSRQVEADAIRIEELVRQRDGWEETALMYAQNVDFWKSKLAKAGIVALETILNDRGPVFDAMIDAAEDAAGKDVSFNVVVGRALCAALTMLAELEGGKK